MSFKRQRFIKEHSEEIKKMIREYLENFIDEGVFDVDKYEESAMEGELFEEINNEFYDAIDDEGPLVVDGTKDSDRAFELVDQLVDIVLLEPGMELPKAYFDSTPMDYKV